MTMTKLIATEFTYTWTSRVTGKTETARGSYLGRKVATVDTLRRFVQGNIKSCNSDMVLKSLTVGGNYVSKWVAK